MSQKEIRGTAPKILIVDDRPENLYSLEVILKKPGMEIITADSGQQALRALLVHDIALILLDVQMPEMDGFETAELIRCNARTQYIPIIFVTANSKEETQVFKGYESGAVDYIFKPLVPEILQSKVAVFLELYAQKQTIQTQNHQLNAANQQILKQQGALIEEERVKVVLQMAGAAANELSEPLMILLGNVELMLMDAQKNNIDTKPLTRIQNSGQRLAEIVRRIQKVDHQETIAHDSSSQVIRLDHTIQILCLEQDKAHCLHIKDLVESVPNIRLKHTHTIKDLLKSLSQEKFHLLFLSRPMLETVDPDTIRKLNRKRRSTPVICLCHQTEDLLTRPGVNVDVHDQIHIENMERRDLLQLIKDALEKARLNHNIQSALTQMAAMSTRDELTGLFNRRYLKERLTQEFKRAKRYDLPLSCLLLDLDHFKNINDIYGHQCGDLVLKEFAALLKACTRESDFIFRYGGEEFLVLLPQTQVDGAVQVGESIGRKCRNTPFHCNEDLVNLTVSIGLSTIHTCPADSGMGLVKCADKALYEAKGAGRDCLKIHGAAETIQGFNIRPKPEARLEKQFISILNRSKQASVRAFHLLVREMGGPELEEETHKTIQIIRHLCRKLEISPAQTESISQAAALHNCFRCLLGEEILTKPKELSPDDRLTLEQLPHHEVNLINRFDFFEQERSILFHNAERYDGKG